MRILWLPHHEWSFIRRGQREFRFAELIKGTHDVHFVTWRSVHPRPGSIVRSLGTGHRQEDGLTIHQARRVPNLFGERVHRRSARGLWVNEWLHRRAVRQTVARERIDLVICGISHQSVGLPPDDLDVPLVFDYLDYKLERWPEVEAEYMRVAEAVLCTSRVLLERAERLHPHAYYLPNGVDTGAAEAADGERVRRRYELDGSPVVSLIGLTASTDLFWVDGVAAAARDVPGLTFLLVGDGGDAGEGMVGRARQQGLRVVATGPVPPDEVADYFAASDVGLYPGDQTPYFDAACPLKVLEYTAARKPVVATDLAELRNWSFPNVRLAAPTEEAFRGEIKRALAEPHGYPDLAEFGWAALGRRLLDVLDDVAARGKR